MRALLALLLFAASLFGSANASAQSAETMQAAVDVFLRAQTAQQTGRVSIEVAKAPESPRFSPCTQWQAFLPAGTRPWGKISVGLRCIRGGTFSLYLSARVRVEGSYLVAAKAIPAGKVIESNDLRQVQGELSAQASDLLVNESEALGRTAKVSLAADRPLQHAFLRAKVLIEAGESIQIQNNSPGLLVSNQGTALSSASQGQLLRVKLANGRILTAIAKAKGLAETRN